jgi:hypothetical protein
MRQMLRSAAAVLTACGLMALAIAGTDTPAIAGTDTAAGDCVTVTSNGSSVVLGRAEAAVEHGTVCFTVSSTNPGIPFNGGGSLVVMFQPKHGVTLKRALRDFKDNILSSTPAGTAKGTRELVRDVTLYGLATVVVGHPETVTENLRAGTYYLWDLINPVNSGAPLPVPVALTVTEGGESHPLRAPVHVAATSADRFIAPGTWPHQGTYLFHNVSDTLHESAIVPVKPGTTDKEIQAFFDSGGTFPLPFLAAGPFGGSQPVSPGRTIQVAYNLPKGTYVLMCFVPDAKTGIPHVFMGMHKVIKLK